MPTKQPESGALARAVSAEVRAAMGRHRVSGMQLAGLTGMSQNYIAKRLRDEAPFTVNDIENISNALSEDVAQLWIAAVAHLGEK
jgi:transcriptional regulator with XRE-family HTH domain